jgi:lipopolysaccharide heptosyltransferase I
VRIDAHKIAIVRLGSIGDVVNTLPLLNRLRAGYPQSRITWIVEEKSAAILEGHPALDSLIVFPRSQPGCWLQFATQLRSAGFDLVLDCQRMLRSGVLVRLSGAPYRIGFDRGRCREGSWIFTTHRIHPNHNPGVMIERFLEFADFLELPPTKVSWDISIGQVEHERVSQVVGIQGSSSIAINVGASKSEKLWPAEHFIEVIRLLQPHWNGRLVLTGAMADEALAARIAGETGALDTVGRFSLRELAALLGQAALVLSCDSGPLHLAVAMGTPVIGLYGPSDPGRTGPYGQANWVLSGWGGSRCRSCRRWCGDPYTPCMRSISPEMVFDKIEKRLGGHPSWLP